MKGLTMLQIFEMVQRLLAVEHSYVASLRRRQPPHRPAQVNEMRLDWQVQRMHPDLVRQ